MAAATERIPVAAAGAPAASTALSTTEAASAKPLYASQEELPPLPLPPLSETMEKLLRSARALATDEEYEHLEAVVADFQAGVGASLQTALEERAAESRNWLEDWWMEFIYLRPRWPIAVWVNYLGANIGNDTVPFSLSQPQAAAVAIHQLLRFRELVVTETLPPETLAGRPLCMDQYSRMFNSCRVPGEDCDSIETFPHDQRHIIVLRSNRMFKLNVLDSDGRPLSISDLMHGMEQVLLMASSPFELEVPPPVSILTSEERHVWAKARQHMIDFDATNKASLDTIEKALFCVALERTDARTLEERAHNALLGTGLNRYYDKPFTVIVWPNGVTGINGEHTWADAMVVVKQQDACMREIAKMLKRDGAPARSAPSKVYEPPTLLQWKLDTTTLAAIELASCNITKLISTVELKTLEFHHFGRDMIKRYKITPDFFVQMAIQLGHYRLHKEFVATYETAHTRLFYHGRTETIRTLSLESVAFVKAMMSDSASDSERFDKLKAAVDAHGAYVKDAMMGKAVDRHLLGLQIAAEIQAIKPKPALFTDPCFLKSRKFALSTSNVSISSTSTFGGYAPFFAGGYGVCYSLQDNMINACITSIKGTRTNAEKLRDAISEALMDLMKLCFTRNIMYIGAAKL